MEDVDRLTLHNYSLLLDAYKFKELDRQHNLHWTAWINARAYDEKAVGSGKNQKIERAYKSFNEFFDEDEWLETITGEVEEEEPSEELEEFYAMIRKINGGGE